MSQNHTSAGVLILQWKKRLSSDNFDDSLLVDLQSVRCYALAILVALKLGRNLFGYLFTLGLFCWSMYHIQIMPDLQRLDPRFPSSLARHFRKRQ